MVNGGRKTSKVGHQGSEGEGEKDKTQRQRQLKTLVRWAAAEGRVCDYLMSD
jgi:hypothetical protein